MVTRRSLVLVVGFCCGRLGFPSCSAASLPATSAAAPQVTFQSRATNVFTEADFFKPTDRADAGLIFQLAPLLLQEVKGDRPPSEAFGVLSLSNNVPHLDPAQPAVYYSSDFVRLAGRELARFAYLWCYLSPVDASVTELQGVRVTLNSAGMPAFWEVLTDPSGTALVYVSRQVETAALAEFGRALPGRRFGIERAREEAPDTVLVRILEDGPVPMGPLVYVEAGSRAVTGVLCRCMPSQAKQLRQTRTYELLPNSDWLLRQVRRQTRTAFWPGEPASDQHLARSLRLPSKF